MNDRGAGGGSPRRWRRRVVRVLLGLGLAIAALAGVLVVRAVRMPSRQPPPPAGVTPLALPPEAELAAHLAGALRLATVSGPAGPVDPRAFLALHGYLEATFPRVHQALRREIVGDYSLLYTWAGSEPALPPLLLLAHLDVVPAEVTAATRWAHPPFAGEIADGFVWGRGAMDDKLAAVTLLEAAEHLLASGFQPRRTILLAFGHDEEISGERGAARIAALLGGRGVRAALVLDEGMAITEGIVDGIARPVALVGVAEKGFADIVVSARVLGGHSSMPPASTAVGVLARAIAAIEAAPMPARLDGAARQMLEYLAPEMAFGRRVLMANLWLLAPVVERVLAGAPSGNALVRTTLAPTMLAGSDRSNALPARASATVNVRILPGDTVDDVLTHLRKVVGDPRVTIEATGEPVGASAISPSDDALFAQLVTTILEVAPGAVVAPGLVLGTTDSKHYARLSDHVYRFSPMRVGPADLPRLHGVDERVAVADLRRAVEFYARLMARLGAGAGP